MRVIERLRKGRPTYRRSGDRWRCGHGEEGACRRGPDEDGRCRAGSECDPRLEGERWRCNRPAHRGGPCAAGPLPDGRCGRRTPPCLPLPGERAARGRWVAGVALLVVATLLWLLAGERRDWLISPGPLAPAHAPLADECAACHRVARGHWSSWPAAALGDGGEGLDERCLACHRAGERPAGPHGLPAHRLPKRAHGLPADAEAGQRCTDCHREHRGDGESLRRVDDAVCERCHHDTFRAFADHPPFELITPRRLHFDHPAHQGKHFRDPEFRGRAPEDCTGCHRTTERERRFATPTFESGCAGCHQGRLFGDGLAGARGVSVLSVPGLEREALAGLGEWPEDADGAIHPFTRLLLAADAGVAADLKAIAGLDLLDLSEAGDAQREAVARVAWAFKGLVAELAAGGQEALGRRLAALTGEPPERPELADLAAGLPPAVLTEAAHRWFPHLREELAARLAGEPPPVFATEPPAEAPPAAPSIVEPASGDDDLLAADGEEETLLIDQPSSAGDELLVEAPNDDLLAGDAAEDDLLLTGDPVSESPAEIEASDPEPALSAEERAPVGGWYLEWFDLRYRPTGHADPLSRAWLDLLGGLSTPAARLAYAELGDPKAPGGCLKCHRAAAGAAPIWRARADAAPGFTPFSHRPHLAHLDGQGCARCHRTADGGDEGRDHRPIPATVCADCHRPGGAAERCTTCHRYHPEGVRPLAR